jgi:Ca2+-binding RTX toxin-like protein
MDNFFDLTDGPDNRSFAPGELAFRPVRGLDGDDTISGSGDADDINGNRGNDSVIGGSGNDTIRGGQETDSVFGGDGVDLVNGNLGNDYVDGGLGDDIVRGGQNEDFLFGDLGNDFLYGDLGEDTLVGGGGNDIFVLRTDTGVANPLFADSINDFGNGADLIGLTGGTTEADLSLLVGSTVDPSFGAGDTVIRLGATGNYLGVVFGVTPGALAGLFTSTPS